MHNLSAHHPALALLLTCTDCGATREPAPEDFAFGRLGCPDPDCRGWRFVAELTVPEAGGR